MRYRVVFTPEAHDHLASIFRYVAGEASVDAAMAFVGAVVDYCESFITFPHRGTRRDDIRVGLCTVGFRRRATIAFMVERQTIAIIGVFYGGRNVEVALRRGRVSRSRSR